MFVSCAIFAGMTIKRSYVFFLAFLAAGALMPGIARTQGFAVYTFAPDEMRDITWYAEKNRKMRLTVQDGRYVVHLPGGGTQTLMKMDLHAHDAPLPLAGGKARVMIADITFDGGKDVLIHFNISGGQANLHYRTFLWDSRSGHFRNGPTIVNPALHTKRKILSSAEISSGIAHYSDYLGEGPMLREWRRRDAIGPLWQIRYFDRHHRPAGTVIAVRDRYDMDDVPDRPAPAILFVSTRHSCFYSRPDDRARLPIHVDRGDRVIAIDAAGDMMEWLKVRYHSRTRDVTGWLKMETLALPGYK